MPDFTYIHKDDKSPHDPTEYVVFSGEIRNRDDIDEWEYQSWIGGVWWPIIRLLDWSSSSDKSNFSIPDDFPMRIRRKLR